MDKGKIKKIIKACLGINKKEGLSVRAFNRSWHRRLGPLFYRRKYTAGDVVAAMQRAGMKEGSTILIQSSWKEFYNCTSSPIDLIEELLNFLGPNGTLCMACMPYIRDNEPFDLVNAKTTAGYLAECFRKMPGVKRSINTRHSVCAIGKHADYLLGEHHMGETAWDEKSPYYKLSTIEGALVFGFGLGAHWLGTIAHCPESLLKGQVPYYTDLWDKELAVFRYIDYDGVEKSYTNYSMPESGPKMRLTSYFKQRHIIKKYLHSHYQHISNLQISCFEANEVVTVLTDLARKGIDICLTPSKRGYKFEK